MASPKLSSFSLMPLPINDGFLNTKGEIKSNISNFFNHVNFIPSGSNNATYRHPSRGFMCVFSWAYCTFLMLFCQLAYFGFSETDHFPHVRILTSYQTYEASLSSSEPGSSDLYPIHCINIRSPSHLIALDDRLQTVSLSLFSVSANMNYKQKYQIKVILFTFVVGILVCMFSSCKWFPIETYLLEELPSVD